MPCSFAVVGTLIALAAPIDGDTLRVGQCRLRLAGIDTPELKGACLEFAADARERLRELSRRGVTITADYGRDRYGRPLVDVASPDGRDVGEVLMREGFARRYRPGIRGWCP